MYVLHQIFGNIKKHWFPFMILLFQLTLVMAFLFYTVNLICSLNVKSDNIKREILSSDYMIISADKTDEALEFDNKSILFLDQLNEPDVRFSHLYYYRFYVDFMKDPSKVFYIFLCDELFMSKIIGLDESVYDPSVCFVGNDVLSYISEYGDVLLNDISINVEGDIQANDQPIRKAELDIIDKIFSVNGNSLGAFYDIKVSDCIFLPDKYDVRDAVKAYEKLFVFFATQDRSIEEKIDFCRDTIRYLESDNEVTYTLGSKLSKLNYEYVIVQEEIDTYLFLTFLSVSIIIFAVGGIKIIQLYYDRKRIAISMALGASLHMMILEITGDNIFIHAGAVLSGIFIGAGLCVQFPNYLTDIHIYPLSFFILVITALASYFLSYIIMRKDFLQITLIKILK